MGQAEPEPALGWAPRTVFRPRVWGAPLRGVCTSLKTAPTYGDSPSSAPKNRLAAG